MTEKNNFKNFHMSSKVSYAIERGLFGRHEPRFKQPRSKHTLKIISVIQHCDDFTVRIDMEKLEEIIQILNAHEDNLKVIHKIIHCFFILFGIIGILFLLCSFAHCCSKTDLSTAEQITA